MPAVIPSRIPGSSSRGEQRVHSLLQRLPGNCVAYYEPDVNGRHPDFIVILPTLGLLVIEVKGWRSTEILGGDSDTIQVKTSRDSTVTQQIAPARQAWHYFRELKDVARQSRFADRFLEPDGLHQGKFRFPIGCLVVLSNVSDLKMDAGLCPLRKLFPPQRHVTSTTLEHWEKLEPEALLAELARFFHRFWPIAPMHAEDVKALRAVIHPEIYFEDRVSIQRLQETPLPVREQAGVVMTLDERQEDFARSTGEGHRVIYGVAGSGKTLLLIGRAKWLAVARPGSRTLLVCYNRALASWLGSRVANIPGVEVKTFHQFAWSCGVRGEEDDAKLGESLLGKLEKGHGKRFDAILVDEAQDFEPLWFRCLVASLKDPENGDLLVVADGSQGLYDRGRIKWSSLGIKARGRTACKRFQLDQNYRNPSEVIALAETFAHATLRNEEPGEDPLDYLQAVRVELSRCVRSVGQGPLFVRADDRSSELAAAQALIEDLLQGRWNGKAIAPLQPEDIAVLYPRSGNEEKQWLDQFAKNLNACGFPAIWLTAPTGPRNRVLEPGVKIQTIHSAKGLQYRAVMVIWTDMLPSYRARQDGEKWREERRQLYVAMTRTESFLALTASGPSPFVDEIESCAAVEQRPFPARRSRSVAYGSRA